VPLITASILSKKLAAGLDNLVLDVKTGSGAFMEEIDSARLLAQSLVDTANGAGLKTAALLTDMDEPLASTAGNAVEVQNAVDFLTGSYRDQRLYEVTLALGAELLTLAGLSADRRKASKQLSQVLDSGEAAERFQRMVKALGGPTDFIERARSYLPAAPIVHEVHATADGHVAHIKTRELGLAVIELGGGRRRASDPIDHAVGLTRLIGKGAKTDKFTPLAVIHARDETSCSRAADIVRSAYELGETSIHSSPVIERIGPPDP
jgi:thymidine phosphorylase